MDGREKQVHCLLFLLGLRIVKERGWSNLQSNLYFNRFNNIALFVLQLALLYHFCQLIFADGSEGELITLVDCDPVE